MKNFCAIDSATTSLAFSHFKDGSLLKFGIIKFSGNGIYDKVTDIAQKTGGLFEHINTEFVIIESTFFSVNPKVTTDLALAQGVILGAASIHGVKHIAGCTPLGWQRFIGNPPLTKDEKLAIVKSNPDKSTSWHKAQPRKIRKQRTIDIINDAYSLGVTDDNVADAIGIGLYASKNWEKLKWQ